MSQSGTLYGSGGRRNSHLLYTAFYTNANDRRGSVDSTENGTSDKMDPEVLDRLEDILHQINTPLYEERTRLEHLVTSLQKQLSDVESDNQALRSQFNEVQALNVEMSRDVETLQNSSSVSLMAHSRQEVAIEHLQRQVEMLTSQLADANEIATTARVELETLQRMHSAIEEERIAAEEEQKTSKEDPVESNHQDELLLKNLAEKDEQMKMLQLAKAELRQALDAAQQRLEEAISDASEITHKCERLHAENRQLREQYSGVVDERDNFESIVHDYDTKLEHSESVIDQLRHQIDELSHELEESHEQNTLLMEDLEHAQSHHDEELTSHQLEEKFINMMDELKPLKEEKMRGMQIDAEHEFFALTFLSAKVNMAQRLKCPQLSDVRMEEMWHKSQSEAVPMHNFHYWIEKQLTDYSQEFKDMKQRPTRKWSTMGPDPRLKEAKLHRGSQRS